MDAQQGIATNTSINTRSPTSAESAAMILQANEHALAVFKNSTNLSQTNLKHPASTRTVATFEKPPKSSSGGDKKGSKSKTKSSAKSKSRSGNSTNSSRRSRSKSTEKSRDRAKAKSKAKDKDKDKTRNKDKNKDKKADKKASSSNALVQQAIDLMMSPQAITKKIQAYQRSSYRNINETEEEEATTATSTGSPHASVASSVDRMPKLAQPPLHQGRSQSHNGDRSRIRDRSSSRSRSSANDYDYITASNSSRRSITSRSRSPVKKSKHISRRHRSNSRSQQDEQPNGNAQTPPRPNARRRRSRSNEGKNQRSGRHASIDSAVRRAARASSRSPSCERRRSSSQVPQRGRKPRSSRQLVGDDALRALYGGGNQHQLQKQLLPPPPPREDFPESAHWWSDNDDDDSKTRAQDVNSQQSTPHIRNRKKIVKDDAARSEVVDTDVTASESIPNDTSVEVKASSTAPQRQSSSSSSKRQPMDPPGAYKPINATSSEPREQDDAPIDVYEMPLKQSHDAQQQQLKRRSRRSGPAQRSRSCDDGRARKQRHQSPRHVGHKRQQPRSSSNASSRRMVVEDDCKSLDTLEDLFQESLEVKASAHSTKPANALERRMSRQQQAAQILNEASSPSSTKSKKSPGKKTKKAGRRKKSSSKTDAALSSPNPEPSSSAPTLQSAPPAVGGKKKVGSKSKQRRPSNPPPMMPTLSPSILLHKTATKRQQSTRSVVETTVEADWFLRKAQSARQFDSDVVHHHVNTSARNVRRPWQPAAARLDNSPIQADSPKMPVRRGSIDSAGMTDELGGFVLDG